MTAHAKKTKPQTVTSLKDEAQPILKWAGGKTQLLPILSANYPQALRDGKIKTYIEPFVGGGAVFFDIANNYSCEQAYLFDTNPDIVTLYNALKHDVGRVIKELATLEKE